MDKDTSVTSTVGRAFAGRAGAVQAVGAWAGLLIIWVTAFLFGAAFFLLAGAGTAVAVIVAWRLAGDWTPGKALMAVSAVLWAACTVVFWWVWRVGFDAADAMRPVPGYVGALSGPSLVVGSTAFLVFWATLARVLVRARRSPAVAPA
jgi:hypothetical protein